MFWAILRAFTGYLRLFTAIYGRLRLFKGRIRAYKGSIEAYICHGKDRFREPPQGARKAHFSARGGKYSTLLKSCQKNENLKALPCCIYGKPEASKIWGKWRK